MANVTATANFRGASAAYKKHLQLFGDFIHMHAGELWMLKKGYEVDSKIADKYNEFIENADRLKEKVIEATAEINSKRKYNLRVA